MDLYDVEAEMMEGERAEYLDAEPEPLLDPRQYPLVGASIGVSADQTGDWEGTGTLGGYIIADGTVYGLTNRHVVLGTARKDAFPSPTETADSISINQPSLTDLKRTIEDEERGYLDLEGYVNKLKDASKRAIYEPMLKIRQDRLQRLKEWQMESLKLGTLTQACGDSIIPLPIRRTRDWAIIKVGNEDRGTVDTTKFVNEVSHFFFFMRITLSLRIMPNSALLVAGLPSQENR